MMSTTHGELSLCVHFHSQKHSKYSMIYCNYHAKVHVMLMLMRFMSRNIIEFIPVNESIFKSFTNQTKSPDFENHIK